MRTPPGNRGLPHPPDAASSRPRQQFATDARCVFDTPFSTMPSAPRRSRIPPVPTLDAANAPPIACPLEPTLLPENRRATCAITSPLPTPPGNALRERRRAQSMENRLGQLRPTQTANCRSKRSSNLPWWAARGTWRGSPQCTDWQSAPMFKSPYSHPDVGAGYD